MSDTQQLTLRSGDIVASVSVSARAFVHRPSPVRNASADSTNPIAEALSNPVGLPKLHDCLVPGDRVVIVVDPATPQLIDIVTTVLDELQSHCSEDLNITLLLPDNPKAEDWQDLVKNCPVHMQGRINLVVHDPRDESKCGYLASSSNGVRVYLNKHLLDADLIISVGVIGFDSRLGYSGTSGVLFPHFSDISTIRDAAAPGHPELAPGDVRPLREVVDEVGWLLGTQFTIQVIPNPQGYIGSILCGMPGDVQKLGVSILEQAWRISLDRIFDVVVVTVSVPSGKVTLREVGAALESACRIVEHGGRIIIVADLQLPEGPGATMLRRCSDPEELLKPLRREPTEDACEVLQLIMAGQKATLALFSQLTDDETEELGFLAINSAAELQRALNGHDDLAIISGMNHAWCDITVAT
ncbi:MAG: DUF2088 domain-containing protein [Planctomycetaceae bacterium]|nr:DUF2088 domain-containing protein [Planctomycetaceae bacterium]